MSLLVDAVSPSARVAKGLGLLDGMKIPTFPGKYEQNGGFSMAMFCLQECRYNSAVTFCIEDNVGFFA